MKDIKQVRENLIDVLEELDEQLGEILEERDEPVQLSIQNSEEKGGEIENASYLDSLWAKTHREMEKIKQSIFHIGKNSEE
ncbi:MAG: hypothetical protein L3J59_08095 [Methylococcaceae bacterium]|nr:hypothetical protein [Methylococcaceae bacterium]